MLGYDFSVRRIDEEVVRQMESILPGKRVEADYVEYRKLILAHWHTALYPTWPENLVDKGLATVRHGCVLSSYFELPLKYVLVHIGHRMEHDGPPVIDASGVTKPGDLIKPVIYHERIARCDPEEIVHISRWDRS